jgi:hypothetical protein
MMDSFIPEFNLLTLTSKIDDRRKKQYEEIRRQLKAELWTEETGAVNGARAQTFAVPARPTLALAPASSELSNTHLQALMQRAEAERKQREKDQQAAIQAERDALAAIRKKEDSVIAAAKSSEGSLSATFRRQDERAKRHDSAHTLDRNNKAIKSVKLHLRTLTNTRRDVQFRLDGTKNELGPRALLDHVASSAAKFLEPTMQVLSDLIVQNASANLAVDALKRGEANYGLAYLTLVLCHSRPVFIDYVLGALEAACPFVQPGLKDHIENEAVKHKWTKEQRRKRLGYRDEETDDDYVVRMQALVGFYAVLLQTTPKLIESYVRLCAKGNSGNLTVTVNPFGGLGEAWRWLAKTTNSTKRRWTRFLIQSFLCVGGRELSLAVPDQMKKLLGLLGSKAFRDACEPSASHPADDDRIRGFETFIKDSLGEIASKGAMRGPGREEENADTGVKVWVDPRVLPEGAQV